MADTPKFQAVLEAVDRISAPIDSVAAKFRALGASLSGGFSGPAGAELGHVGKQLAVVEKDADKAHGRLHKLTHAHAFIAMAGHVRLLHSRLGNLSASIGEVGGRLSELLPMLGGLGAVTSLGGLVEAINRASDQESVLANTAKALGTTTREVLALNLAAEHADVPVTTMTEGFERFNAILGKAASGQNKNALALFQHLHINLHDAHGGVVKLAAVMPKLMEAFRNTHSQAQRSAMAMTLFGRAGIQLLPFLDQGAEAWRRYNAESRRVDYDPTKKEREGPEKFHSSWIDLRHAVDSVEVAIGAKLGPVLRPIVDQFRKWVTANREWIAQKVTDAVKGLADALKKIDIKAVVTDFGHLAKHAIDFGSAIGPVPGTIGALTLALGAPLLHAFVGVIRDMKELTVWAFKAARAIGTTLIGALRSAGQAIKGLDANFHATTIGRMAELTFSLYDAATHLAPMKTNAAQGRYLAALHLQPGTHLTGEQAAHLKSLATPARRGPDFSDRMRAALAHALGLSAAPGRSLYARGLMSGAGLAPAAPREAGTSRVTVDFKNLPQGARVHASAQGGAPVPDVNVGYAAPAFGF